MSEEVLLCVFGIVFSVIGYLLHQKDVAQQKEIRDINTSIQLLFKKHDDDAALLQQFRLEIAEGHYKKQELDTRFDRLEASFKEGFSQLSDKFDRFVDLWQKRNSD
jgi:hypothetical protein